MHAPKSSSVYRAPLNEAIWREHLAVVRDRLSTNPEDVERGMDADEGGVADGLNTGGCLKLRKGGT